MEGSMAGSVHQLRNFAGRFAGRWPDAAGSALVAGLALTACPLPAQAPTGPGLVPAGDVAQGNINAGDATVAVAGAHPLEPALAVAQRGLDQLRTTIKDYSCTVVKRERIDGKLGDHQYLFAKIRHEPFSVYLYFLAPDDVKGQEVIFV